MKTIENINELKKLRVGEVQDGKHVDKKKKYVETCETGRNISGSIRVTRVNKMASNIVD